VATIPDGLLGAWTLLSYEDREDGEGAWTRPYGEAGGLVVYHPSGALAVIVTAGSGAAEGVTGLSYFGRFEVRDWTERDGAISGIVLHHMDGASDPELLRDEPERDFILTGDTLILGDRRTHRRTFLRS